MLIEIPPKMNVSSFIGFLKGKSNLMIDEKRGEHEVQISEPRILVSRVLRRYRREKYEKDTRVHSKAVERRSVGENSLVTCKINAVGEFFNAP